MYIYIHNYIFVYIYRAHLREGLWIRIFMAQAFVCAYMHIYIYTLAPIYTYIIHTYIFIHPAHLSEGLWMRIPVYMHIYIYTLACLYTYIYYIYLYIYTHSTPEWRALDAHTRAESKGAIILRAIVKGFLVILTADFDFEFFLRQRCQRLENRLFDFLGRLDAEMVWCIYAYIHTHVYIYIYVYIHIFDYNYIYIYIFHKDASLYFPVGSVLLVRNRWKRCCSKWFRLHLSSYVRVYM